MGFENLNVADELRDVYYKSSIRSLTRRDSDGYIGDRDIHVHAALGRLANGQGHLSGLQQEARGVLHAAQLAHRHLQPRDAALRHHALCRLAQLEARLHL